MRANPQVVGAAIVATPPRGTAPVVVAATEIGPASTQADPGDVAANRTGAPAAVLNAVCDRLEIRLPRHDGSYDTVGTLRLTYLHHAGLDRGALERSAEGIRDRLHRRISHAANLFDPYPYEPDARSNNHAQNLVEECIDRHPQVQ